MHCEGDHVLLAGAALAALRCPQPRVMAPTSAGPPMRDPKMSRERSGCTWSAFHSGVRAGLVQRFWGPLGPTAPQRSQPLGDSLMDSWEAFRGVAWTLQRRSLD
jgi:hypothetical protein